MAFIHFEFLLLQGNACWRSRLHFNQLTKSWGFFRITQSWSALESEHMDYNTVRAYRQVKQVETNGKEFFALPMERKLPVRAPDFVSAILAGLLSSGNPSGGWKVSKSRRDLKAFFTPMLELSRFLVEESTEALGLSRDAFTRLGLTESNSNCTGRMNHYPVCPEPDAMLGIPSHGDTQMMAILHQDDIGGLQVLKDGQWVGIQPDDTTFVVNVGDTFMALANGILHRAAHRAVVNAKKDRYSTVYFTESTTLSHGQCRRSSSPKIVR